MRRAGSEGGDGGSKDPKDKLKDLLKVMADKKREQGSGDKGGNRKKRGPKLAQPTLKDMEGRGHLLKQTGGQEQSNIRGARQV